jgi:hypothetical protein
MLCPSARNAEPENVRPGIPTEPPKRRKARRAANLLLQCGEGAQAAWIFQNNINEIKALTGYDAILT